MRKFKCRIHSILLRSQPWVEVEAYNAQMAAEEFAERRPEAMFRRVVVVDQEDGYPHVLHIDRDGAAIDQDMMSVTGYEGDVVLVPKSFRKHEHLFSTLLGIDWEKRDCPRWEKYYNDVSAPYTYGSGRGARTYEPSPWPAFVMSPRHNIESAFNIDYDVCFLNRYNGERDHLGWHSDDSPEMDPAYPIMVLSLGASRAIEFRVREDYTGPVSFQPYSVTLESGDLLVMPAGFQQIAQHRIPKVDRKTDVRISLTFRKYLKVTP